MALPKEQTTYIPLAEYLALEEKADCKSEYFAGEIFAMASGSPNHNRISADIATELTIKTRGSGCETFNSDQRLMLPSGLSTYPDVMVVCGKIKYDEQDPHAITNPVLLVEVLSPSTSNYDRGGKFGFYREIETFREYLTIHQDKVHIEHCYKQENGQWILTELTSITDDLILHSISLNLSVKALYQRVEWETNPDNFSRD